MQGALPSPVKLDAISDLEVEVEARLDEMRITVESVLQLEPGSVLPLQRPAGNTIDVFVGNVRVASAEVIVIENNLALRITEFHLEL